MDNEDPKMIGEGETGYGVEDAIDLRQAVIRRRDDCLRANDFQGSVELSHVIAFMYGLSAQVWGEAFTKLALPESEKAANPL